MKQFDYSFGKVDIATLADSKLTLAKSQKSKFDEMKDWVRSPFLEYQCNPRQNGSYFAMLVEVEPTANALTKCAKNVASNTPMRIALQKCKVKEHWVVDEAPTEEASGSN
eukprot:scaffold3056_cov225-Chaetoceros_neogracile.AAC.8